MIYAKTPTSTLTKKQLKKIVKRSMAWCKSNFGENKRKQYKISHMVGNFPFLEDSYGCYDQFNNVVMVNLSNCPTVGRVTATWDVSILFAEAADGRPLLPGHG